MPHSRNYLFTAALWLSSLACVPPTPPGPADDVSISHQHIEGATLSLYRSFAWKDSATVLIDREGRWAPSGFALGPVLEVSVGDQLARRGLRRAPEDPDLWISVQLILDIPTQAQLDAAALDERPSKFDKGSLLLVVTDVHTGRVVWGASASGGVQTVRDDVHARARLEAVVVRLFEGWPLRP